MVSVLCTEIGSFHLKIMKIIKLLMNINVLIGILNGVIAYDVCFHVFNIKFNDSVLFISIIDYIKL